MSHHWPEGTKFEQLTLEVEDCSCVECGGKMHVCDHRHRRIFTLGGPFQITMKLTQCPDSSCLAHSKTVSPEAETGIAMPYWAIGWDVFVWVGHRRFARHWSVPQIRQELLDSYGIELSDDAIENYVRRYQVMLAARQQDPDQLKEAYGEVEDIILTIDGLQPEKGHETLYVVRELNLKRVWFAESLISSATPEIQKLIQQAKEWAQRLGKPVRAWMSDKQRAFVKCIAEEFPGVPHRYCKNHFMRDLAKPVLEIDSQVKVQMRRKVRGLRSIEREILAKQRCEDKATSEDNAEDVMESEVSATQPGGDEESPKDSAGEVTLDYCSAVRGILNDNQGGPLDPPGLRMEEGLREVRKSLQRNLDMKKKCLPTDGWNV